MSTNHHALALEALRTAAQHVEEARRVHAVEEARRVHATEALVSAAAQSAASKLVAELVRATKRPPSWHLGHLDEATFEQVRELLGVAPSEVRFIDLRQHGENVGCVFVLEAEVAGLRIDAQRSAPEIYGSAPAVGYMPPKHKQIWIGDEVAQGSAQ